MRTIRVTPGVKRTAQVVGVSITLLLACVSVFSQGSAGRAAPELRMTSIPRGLVAGQASATFSTRPMRPVPTPCLDREAHAISNSV